jgi:undecaprenyl-diphosphatase
VGNRAVASLRSHPAARRIRAFDAALDKAVDRWRGPALDRVFYPLSSAADHSLLWAGVAAVREATGRGRPGSAIRLIGVLAVESALTNGLIKLVFRRVRPAHDRPRTGPLPFGLRQPVTSAFPSGHATSAFTAAAYLAEDDPLAPAYYLLAVAVAFSRVYVRLHHASDVVFGALLGVAFGRVARRLAPKSPPPKNPPPGMPERPGVVVPDDLNPARGPGGVPRNGGAT